MQIKQYEIWVADLNPRLGTEAGKTRPVVILQTDLLNKTGHPSTLICPITTKTKKDFDILRINLKSGTSGLHQDCDILLDQVRAIDNRRLKKNIGRLPKSVDGKIKESLVILFDLD
jgi:mRNA interferase MazF